MTLIRHLEQTKIADMYDCAEASAKTIGERRRRVISLRAPGRLGARGATSTSGRHSCKPTFARRVFALAERYLRQLCRVSQRRMALRHYGTLAKFSKPWHVHDFKPPRAGAAVCAILLAFAAGARLWNFQISQPNLSRLPLLVVFL